MFRARAFLRRRRSTSTAEDITPYRGGDSVEPSAMSFVEGSPFRPFEAEARKRQAALHHHLNQRPGNSTTGASDSTPEREKAQSISQSMTRKWFGVDEVCDSMDFLPSSSSGTRIQTWLEHHHQPALIPEPSCTPEARSSMQTNPPTTGRDVTSKPSEEGEKGLGMVNQWMWIVLFVQWVVMAMLISLVWGASPFGSGERRVRSSASAQLPFRQKFFEVLIYDESAQRFHTEFNQGVQDAAEFLRVNVRFDRASDKISAIQNIQRARDSLYDGIMITTANDQDYMNALVHAHKETPILALGAFESYSAINTKGLSQVGDREAVVGRLAGQTMREQGMTTVLCLSHADNQESELRCNGFRDAFGKQTYELNLKKTMQSELKSKLLPILLDDREINGLFVADPRAFGLVHQILKSLNRLCTNNKPPKTSRCILFGAYGTDKNILQAIKKRELQFTIDPQEYLRGYVATALLTLQSIGYPTPTTPASELLMSRVVDSSKEATKLLQHKSCQSREVGSKRDLSFKFFLFGEKPESPVSELKRGLREAARDFGVNVQFHHYHSSLNSTEEGAFVQRQLGKCNGAAVAIGQLSDVHLVNDFPFSSVNPLITYGQQFPQLVRLSEASLHIGYDQSEIPTQDVKSPISMTESKRDAVSNSMEIEAGSVVDEFDENPALQGYLSVLFLVINSLCGQLPSGLFSTAVF